MPTMFSRKSRFFAGGILLIGASLASAQQVIVQRGIAIAPPGLQENEAQDAEQILAAQLENQKGIWQNEFQVLISDIDRVCQLAPEQKKKLDVASKGAIEKSLAVWKTQMEQMGAGVAMAGLAPAIRIQPLAVAQAAAGQADIDIEMVAGADAAPQVNPGEKADAKPANDAPAAPLPRLVPGQKPPAEPAAETPKTQTTDDKNSDDNSQQETVEGNAAIAADVVEVRAVPAMGFRVANFAMGGMIPAASPTEQVLWTKSLKMVLTAEQAAKYDAVVAERKRALREGILTNLLNQVDQKLLLTPEQLTPLRQVIAKHYGDALENSNGGMLPQFFGGGIEVFGGLEQDQQKFRDEIQGILSPAQTELWKQNFQAQLDFAKLNQPGGFPPPAAPERVEEEGD